VTRRRAGRVYTPGDVARLRRPVALDGHRRELPVGTIVTVIAEVEPERSREAQVLRCSVGVKSIVGYVEVKRTWLEPIEGPIEAFVDAIAEIERGKR